MGRRPARCYRYCNGKPWPKSRYNVGFQMDTPSSEVDSSTDSIDRIIIESDNDAAYTLMNTVSDLTVTDDQSRTYQVIIYYDFNMIELKPGVSNISTAQNPTITLANFYAEQYKISPGIVYEMKVWRSGIVIQHKQWQTAIDCDPNDGIDGSITPNSGIEYGSFETFQLTITPYNAIPKEGMI